jgi:uncharacterized protein
MSDLRTRLSAEIITAMKAKQPERLQALRSISAELKQRDIDARPEPALTDAQIISMLGSMVKKRKESIALYESGGHVDAAAKEQAEIVIISEYLPASMSDEDLKKAIQAIIQEVGAASMKDMRKVMAGLKEKHDGSFDGIAASALVKSLLNRA